ncbi:FxSxx-COOH system tetratricopeptide repeat protein [Glycomyces sp. A-F 0318]|uniref:FxSxx-COOH system tetratricopeptide repeat protein n=1 Tax=Glycomyces amatae TaxID=2881355 RepID=UPI001E4B7D7A|nr:FxSxx-COOH system tetratricopeptide repeat protein [Glycomyces amatae]MCD0444747.1 FxSxx-COOH system tetratricopeptide repeat protein [Glycomyces amatae]
MPSLREIARDAVNVSHTSVADTFSGKRAPSWRIAREVGLRLNGDEATLRRLWEAAVLAKKKPKSSNDETAKTTFPCVFGIVPRLAAARQMREADAQLEVSMGSSEFAPPTQILSGMGGVGKTQIAAAYAQRHWNAGDIDLLLWIDASRRDNIVMMLDQAASALLGSDGGNGMAAAERLLSWIRRPNGPRWLIILDDLCDPADMEGLWPPASPRGKAIITTRRRDAALDGYDRVRIDVGLFNEVESINYLRERLHGDARVLEEAEALSWELGFLPLALSQAAAFIIDQPGLTCAEYRHLLHDRKLRLSELSPDRLPDGYPLTVEAMVSLSVQAASLDSGEGVYDRVLQITSVLDPVGIPVDILKSRAVRKWISSAEVAESKIRNDLVYQDSVSFALARLHRLSLLDFDGQTIQMHPLVSYIVVSMMSRSELVNAIQVAASALVEKWDESSDTPAGAAVMRSNANRVKSVDSSALFQEGAHPVLFLIGQSLGDHAYMQDAANYFTEFSQNCEVELGHSHPDTLRSRSEALYWLARLGRPSEARPLVGQIVTDHVSVFGPHAHETLNAHRNLAAWCAASGDLGRALEIYELLLDDLQKALGPDHYETLRTRHQLAQLQGNLGDASGAASVLVALVNDMDQFMGTDHAEKLLSQGDLAYWRGKSGDLNGARRSLEELLTECIRILGADHPHTLKTRGDLARWRGEAGDVSGALLAFEELLADSLRVFGPEHPETLRARVELARWRGFSGDALRAVAGFEELLPDLQRVLGPDHPDTFRARAELARWHGDSGDAPKAVAAFSALLGDRPRVLGPDHPYVLRVRAQLARWYGEAGHAATAVATFEELLPDFVRVLGDQHPRTLRVRGDLARWRGASGEFSEAVEAFEELLPDFISVLGSDHPHTLRARLELARWKGEAGGAQEAAAAIRRLLDDLFRVLGPDHPDTLRARAELARWLGAAGEHASAVAAFEQLLADRPTYIDLDNHNVLRARAELAHWRGESGDTFGALSEIEALLPEMMRVLGQHHPRTFRTRADLAHWRGLAGDIDGAIADLERILADVEATSSAQHFDGSSIRKELSTLKEMC